MKRAVALPLLWLAFLSPPQARCAEVAPPAPDLPRLFRDSLYADGPPLSMDVRGQLDRNAVEAILKEVLDDATRRPSPHACVSAMLEHRAFQHAPRLKNLVERFAGEVGGADLRALQALAFLEGQDKSTADYCEAVASRALTSEEIRKRTTAGGGDLTQEVQCALLTLWAVGADVRLIGIRNAAIVEDARFVQMQEKTSPSAIEVACNQTRLSVISQIDALQEYRRFRNRVVDAPVPVKLQLLAEGYLDPDVLENNDLRSDWIPAVFCRHSSPETATQAIRAALARILTKPIPRQRQLLIHLDALDWMNEVGTGLNDADVRKKEEIRKELQHLKVPTD